MKDSGRVDKEFLYAAWRTFQIDADRGADLTFCIIAMYRITSLLDAIKTLAGALPIVLENPTADLQANHEHLQFQC